MLLKEVAAESPAVKGTTLQIFASDLSTDAILAARKAQHPDKIAADVGPARLARFFSADGDGYLIDKQIREMLLFAQHDVQPAPRRRAAAGRVRDAWQRASPVHAAEPEDPALLAQQECCQRQTSEFRCPQPCAAKPAEGAQSVATGHAIRQPAGACRTSPAARIFARSGAGQRTGRCGLHQRQRRQVPGAGVRQGQLEHPRRRKNRSR